MKSNANLTERLTWLLYTDVNTRLNLMMDECLHLEKTIHSFLKDDEGPVIASYPMMRDQPGYYFRSPQERALEHLRRTMYGMRKSLGSNQEEIRQAYKKTLVAVTDETGALYWFISLRGHFLTNVLDLYLKHIQHAHEKLVQLLENMPGTTPTPTLLRRWSSAGYGEFLSEYSRAVNLEIQYLIWKFCSADEGGGTKFEDWRHGQYMVHTWAHQATSTTRSFKATPDQDGDPRAKQHRYTTIWSSYFYLEQPILLPLLYHECAHHFSSNEIFGDENGLSATTRKRRRLWIERPKETAALLNRLIELEEPDETFWAGLVTEIWADALSIALCGKGFLSALFLQLAGIPGERNAPFSDFDFENDELIPLDQLGSTDRRVWPIPYPEFSLGFFWETRLALAVRTYRNIHGQDESDCEWVGGINQIIDDWYRSGAEAMSPENVSSEHATQWRYRKELNDWATNVIWAHLRELTEELRSFPLAKLTDPPRIFSIDQKGGEMVGAAFNTYSNSVFGTNRFLPTSSSTFNQIEDICIHVRWALSKPIIEELLYANEKDNSKTDSENFKKWANTFADYMRSDGSVEFRIGLEWISTRHDVYRTAGAFLGENHNSPIKLMDVIKSIPERDREFGLAVLDAVNRDFDERTDPYENSRETDKFKIAIKLAQKQGISQSIKDRGFSGKNLLNAIHELKFDDHLASALSHVIDHTGKSILVGTFTLGVIRPAYIVEISGVSDKEAQYPYFYALNKVMEYYKKSFENKKKCIQFDHQTIHLSEPTFFGLIGEYSFANFEPFFTPVEKDWQPTSNGSNGEERPPKILAKSRSVIKILDTKPKSEKENFVRISQISFKYRWQWVQLWNELKVSAASTPCELYLSSGWEDVILVTYHRTFENLQSSFESLQFETWQDIHSSLGLLDYPDASSLERILQITTTSECSSADHTPGNGESRITSVLESTNLFKDVYEQTGRHDISVVWKAESPDQLLYGGYSLLPKEVWEKVSNIVTSLITHKTKDSMFVSQIILRHD